MKKLLVICFMILWTSSVNADDHEKAFKFLSDAMNAYGKTSDYTCTFHKKEFVDEEIIESRSELRFKKPFCVFYKEYEGPNKDIACTYIKGKNDNKLATRNTGLLGLMTVNLDPEGTIAMKGNRHPITHVGIGYILESAARDVEKARKNADAVFTYEGIKDVFGKKAHLVKTIYPENKGYYAHIVDLYYDTKTALPLKISMYDWKKKFMEEYGYENLETDRGLADKDFNI